MKMDKISTRNGLLQCLPNKVTNITMKIHGEDGKSPRLSLKLTMIESSSFYLSSRTFLIMQKPFSPATFHPLILQSKTKIEFKTPTEKMKRSTDERHKLCNLIIPFQVFPKGHHSSDFLSSVV